MENQYAEDKKHGNTKNQDNAWNKAETKTNRASKPHQILGCKYRKKRKYRKGIKGKMGRDPGVIFNTMKTTFLGKRKKIKTDVVKNLWDQH